MRGGVRYYPRTLAFSARWEADDVLNPPGDSLRRTCHRGVSRSFRLPFHPLAPFACCFGGDKDSASHTHDTRASAVTKYEIEQPTRDSMASAEFRDAKSAAARILVRCASLLRHDCPRSLQERPVNSRSVTDDFRPARICLQQKQEARMTNSHAGLSESDYYCRSCRIGNAGFAG